MIAEKKKTEQPRCLFGKLPTVAYSKHRIYLEAEPSMTPPLTAIIAESFLLFLFFFLFFYFIEEICLTELMGNVVQFAS